MRIESQPENGTKVYFSARFKAVPGEEGAIPEDGAMIDSKKDFNRRKEYEDDDDDLRGLNILAVDDSEVPHIHVPLGVCIADG
jgi:hypothetical protein